MPAEGSNDNKQSSDQVSEAEQVDVPVANQGQEQQPSVVNNKTAESTKKETLAVERDAADSKAQQSNPEARGAANATQPRQREVVGGGDATAKSTPGSGVAGEEKAHSVSKTLGAPIPAVLTGRRTTSCRIYH